MALYYSCDSHVVEPPEVFEGLDKEFGTRAPYYVQDPPGKKGTYIVLGHLQMNIGRMGIAGSRLDDPKTIERMERGYDGMNPGVRDPVERLKEQDIDGVAGEVMYPTINMATFSMQDREVAHAMMRRHNDWIRDYCSEAPERLIGIACLPLPDVDAAIAELQRIAKMGHRAAAIPCTAPVDKPYFHPDFEPFWDVAEEVGLPLSMHIFCGSTWDMGLPAHWGTPAEGIMGYTLAHTGSAVSMGQLIYGGVCEHHPKLRFVNCEFETGWLAHFLQRLDHATYRARAEASPDLTMQPSEYWRRQFYATFEDDEAGVLTRRLIGVDNLIWGNDYPHHDSIWPNSRAVIDRIFDGVPDDEREKMTSTNVMKLYGIHLPATVSA
ncbi:MAG: hypothetical protein ETSY1_28205 [Candidatus Entotheonella factor]|uniref:Amidohydrolase-related domain-containing protein n=1 Tax=Entotheonella factor TaxID=1429438 RepID=W4LFA8_ENTF1|nr:amidohydrolase family protein [Candidatus Entotheonella palauensis]ETW96026.1 MAG: hypothetical protein ETSY1_28205 [Candidatus Entotheonella factor]